MKPSRQQGSSKLISELLGDAGLVLLPWELMDELHCPPCSESAGAAAGSVAGEGVSVPGKFTDASGYRAMQCRLK